MIYENNTQIIDIFREIMRTDKITYDEIADRMGCTKQNAYKIINKNQIKLDDVKRLCNILGCKFEIGISKLDKELSPEVFELYVNDQFMESVAKLINIAKDVDFDDIYRKHQRLKNMGNNN